MNKRTHQDTKVFVPLQIENKNNWSQDRWYYQNYQKKQNK